MKPALTLLRGGADPERLARALAELHDEGGPADPGRRLAALAARLGPEPRGEPAEPSAPPAAAPAAAAPAAAPPPSTAAAAPDLHDELRRTVIEYGAVLKRYREDFDRLFARAPDAAVAEDATLRRLHEARSLLVKYPVAAQAAFAALVAEGRRFAETPEGQRWQATLADSDLVRRGRALFQGITLDVLGEHAGPLPSGFLEAFIEATRRGDAEGVLQRLFGQAP
ncbi:MAG: hypothetical protein R3F43_29010 [bacterium]